MLKLEHAKFPLYNHRLWSHARLESTNQRSIYTATTETITGVPKNVQNKKKHCLDLFPYTRTQAFLKQTGNNLCNIVPAIITECFVLYFSHKHS